MLLGKDRQGYPRSLPCAAHSTSAAAFAFRRSERCNGSGTGTGSFTSTAEKAPIVVVVAASSARRGHCSPPRSRHRKIEPLAGPLEKVGSRPGAVRERAGGADRAVGDRRRPRGDSGSFNVNRVKELVPACRSSRRIRAIPSSRFAASARLRPHQRRPRARRRYLHRRRVLPSSRGGDVRHRRRGAGRDPARAAGHAVRQEHDGRRDQCFHSTAERRCRTKRVRARLRQYGLAQAKPISPARSARRSPADFVVRHAARRHRVQRRDAEWVNERTTSAVNGQLLFSRSDRSDTAALDYAATRQVLHASIRARRSNVASRAAVRAMAAALGYEPPSATRTTGSSTTTHRGARINEIGGVTAIADMDSDRGTLTRSRLGATGIGGLRTTATTSACRPHGVAARRISDQASQELRFAGGGIERDCIVGVFAFHQSSTRICAHGASRRRGIRFWGPRERPGATPDLLRRLRSRDLVRLDTTARRCSVNRLGVTDRLTSRPAFVQLRGRRTRTTTQVSGGPATTDPAGSDLLLASCGRSLTRSTTTTAARRVSSRCRFRRPTNSMLYATSDGYKSGGINLGGIPNEPRAIARFSPRA